jgi:hypothetical protein
MRKCLAFWPETAVIAVTAATAGLLLVALARRVVPASASTSGARLRSAS